MTSRHSRSTQNRLDSTIRTLCALVEDQIKAQVAHYWCEYDLRKQLVGCILGSQVRHEMAVASTENLDQAGLLDDAWWSQWADDDFSSLVFNVLSGQRRDLPHSGRHRFSKIRTGQLARARNALVQEPLTDRLAKGESPQYLRQNLVADISGLGPKQASMFLRNIGMSYDLAILDTHVLRFMDMQDLMPMDQARVSTVAGYERVEGVVVRYADTLGCPAGYLDWAIWATMKAAREIGL